MSLKLVKSENDNSNILDNLNPEQKKAVMKINGPVLVIAGAGSGKTRVLTYRIAYLIQSGVSPYNILALTFTNKAAKEMKDRIARLIPPEAADKVWAGTFHSIFARILRAEAKILGYTDSFSIYDDEDSMKVIRNVMNNLGINQQQYPPGNIRSRISWAKNRMVTWQEFQQNAASVSDKQAGLIYEHYEKSLHESNAMDFDDLLLNFINVLQHSNDVLDKYRDRFKYVLVDEYQDTNRAQYMAIKLLVGKHKNICVVGDDAQSIYRWRGAEIKNILDFQSDYPDAEIIRLEQNYRSTKTILAAADNVIKKNKFQIPKTLWTSKDVGDKIEVLNCYDDREEADKIASAILDLSQNGNLSFKDFAVLYRTNAQSLNLENACRKNKIPYLVIGGMSFYKRKEIKDTLAYLKLLVNPKDTESLLRIINEPPRGLGQTSINHLRNFATNNNISLLDSFKQADNNPELKQRAKNSAKEFAEYIDSWINKMNGENHADFVKNFILSTGMLQFYQEINTEESLDRWNNIQQLLTDIYSFFKYETDVTLTDYLQQISLVSDIDEKDTTKEQVKLMTLHSAKGLEFPVVIIAGLEQGLFPLSKAEFHPEEEEEERRLFYVGITRAEEKLFLSYAQRRMRFGDIIASKPSNFLYDIDKSHLNWKPGKDQSYSYKVITKSSSKTYFNDFTYKDDYSQIHESNINIFKVGDKVHHKQFGAGKIEHVSGSEDNQQATVYFQSVGRKKLMLKFAKLTKI